jgi:predicted dehydrogenase
VWGLIGGATWGEREFPVFGSYHGQNGTIVQRYDELRVYQADPSKPYEGEWQSVPLDYRAGIAGPGQRYFTDTILKGHRIEGAVTPEVGRATQEIIEAAYRSAETNQTIQLPL